MACLKFGTCQTQPKQRAFGSPEGEFGPGMFCEVGRTCQGQNGFNSILWMEFLKSS